MRKVLQILIIFFSVGCSENLFDEIANKDTDEAIYFQAKQEINARNYALAATLLDSLSASFMGVRERVPIHASAHAGLCGLEFLTLLNSMQNLGSATVLGALMGGFPGALEDPNVLACIEAENILDSIGNESQRNGDENLLMSFNGLAKIGTILSSHADIVGIPDGITDVAFDQCDATHLPDLMVRELGASIAVTLLSLTAIGTSYVDGALSDVTALCALHPSLNAFCTSTNPATFSPVEVQVLRSVIGSNDFGINTTSCAGLGFAACLITVPCP